MNNKLLLYLSNYSFLGVIYYIIYNLVSQNAYITIIIGSIIGIINIIIIDYLKKYIINKYIFILFNIYIIIFILVILPLFINNFYLFNTPKLLIILPLLLLACFIGYKGKKNIIKLSSLLYYFNIFIVLLSILLLYKNMDINNILPNNIKIYNLIKSILVYSSSSSIILLLLKDYNYTLKDNIKSYLISSLILLLISLTSILVLNPVLIKTYSFPSFIVLKRINILGFFQNIEIFLSIFWYINYIITLSVCTNNLITYINNKYILSIIFIIIVLFTYSFLSNNYILSRYVFEMHYLILYIFLLLIFISKKKMVKSI